MYYNNTAKELYVQERCEVATENFKTKYKLSIKKR